MSACNCGVKPSCDWFWGWRGTLAENVVDQYATENLFSYAYMDPWDGSPFVPKPQAIVSGGFSGDLMVFPIETCYLKVWLAITTDSWISNDQSGDPITSVVLKTGEWIGRGNPCFSGIRPSDTANLIPLIQGLVLQAQVPALSAMGGYNSVYATVLKWSFLKGYEPDISDPNNPQPNGFPDPAWQVQRS